ncbi:hypothetical protein SprV_0802490500 [Sparganum proliferum]
MTKQSYSSSRAGEGALNKAGFIRSVRRPWLADYIPCSRNNQTINNNPTLPLLPPPPPLPSPPHTLSFQSSPSSPAAPPHSGWKTWLLYRKTLPQFASPCPSLPCHADFLSASRSLSIRCWDARGLTLASRVLQANQRCPSLIGWRTLRKRKAHTRAGSEHLEGGHRQIENLLEERARGDCLQSFVYAVKVAQPNPSYLTFDLGIFVLSTTAPPWRFDGAFCGTPSIRRPGAVIGRPRRRHQDSFDDRDAITSSLFAEKNRLRGTFLDRPTDADKAGFYQCRRPAQQWLSGMLDAWTARKAEEIKRYADRDASKEYFAAIKTICSPQPKEAHRFSALIN